MREMGYAPQEELLEDDTYDTEDALVRSGLTYIKLPRKGSAPYQRLIDTAEKYIEQIKNHQRARSNPRVDGENYVNPIRPVRSSSSDPLRRQYHDQLTVMMLGKHRTDISKGLANQVSNFAAYLTGNEDYIGTW